MIKRTFDGCFNRWTHGRTQAGGQDTRTCRHRSRGGSGLYDGFADHVSPAATFAISAGGDKSEGRAVAIVVERVRNIAAWHDRRGKDVVASRSVYCKLLITVSIGVGELDLNRG